MQFFKTTTVTTTSTTNTVYKMTNNIDWNDWETDNLTPLVFDKIGYGAQDYLKLTNKALQLLKK
jgi:hypothetical protein